MAVNWIYAVTPLAVLSYHTSFFNPRQRFFPWDGPKMSQSHFGWTTKQKSLVIIANTCHNARRKYISGRPVPCCKQRKLPRRGGASARPVPPYAGVGRPAAGTALPPGKPQTALTLAAEKVPHTGDYIIAGSSSVGMGQSPTITISGQATGSTITLKDLTLSGYLTINGSTKLQIEGNVTLSSLYGTAISGSADLTMIGSGNLTVRTTSNSHGQLLFGKEAVLYSMPAASSETEA